MPNFWDRMTKRLLGKPATAGYRAHHHARFQTVRDLPVFTFLTIREMLIDPIIRLGLAMRAAPLCQAEFAYREGDKWVQGIKCDNPEVAEFVEEQVRRIWKFDLHKILSAQIWGWSAGEVTYRLVENKIHVDRILSRLAYDVIALEGGGEVKGVRFERVPKKGRVDLRFPQCFWHSYDPEAESPYGWSALKGAHSPWWDKWGDGAALDTRRLFMHKDAYGGVDMTHPPGTTDLGGDEPVPNRDIAREIAEQIYSGGVTIRPQEYDEVAGKPLWDLTRATVPSNPQHILQYPHDLDGEMLNGMEIPDDVIKSEVTGAWQGKQVPMLAFYTNADRWLAQVVMVVQSQILEPLVLLNWGEAIDFEVCTKPLADQAMEQMQQAEGSQMAPQEPAAEEQQEIGSNGHSGTPVIFRRQQRQEGLAQRFGLEDTNTAELLVGQGVLEASHLVQAGRDYLSNRNGDSLERAARLAGLTDSETERLGDMVGGIRRMQAQHAPAGGVTIRGKKFRGGEFIPGEVIAKASAAEKAKLDSGSTKVESGTPIELNGQNLEVKQEDGQWFFKRPRKSRFDADPGWTVASDSLAEMIQNTQSPPKGRRTGPAVVAFNDLSIDPGRFQYKIEDVGAEGVTAQFSDVEFNPELAGMLYVWHDTESDKTFVINGHHRYQLAKASGWEGELPVRYIERESAEEARAFGALINIAQGHGTALDAAKFMRDMDMTGKEGLDYFKEHNVSLKGSVAADSLKLANLSDNVFRELAFGRVSLPHAKAIGEHLVPEGDSKEAVFTAQNKLLKKVQGSRLPESVVREMAMLASQAPVAKSSQKGLFGDEEEEVLFEDRARVQAGVREALTKEVRGFGAVASGAREELLRESGVGEVSSAAAGEAKGAAERIRETFDRELRLKGDLGDSLNRILNEAAQSHRGASKGDRGKIIRNAIALIRGMLSTT